MKIIALTMVGNENEIIESFIRYNFNFIDRMIIVTSCCIDNTLVIIRKLIKEGYDIELIEEPEISFDQRYLDNKYLKKIAKEENADFVIPLDADEFLSGTRNPREVLERLSRDRIYTVKWKNYAMRKEDNWDEAFIPKRLCYVKKDFQGNQIEKVVIPACLILEKDIVLETGHHAAFGIELEIETLECLWLAHFPCISKEQYLLRIYESSIKYITWRKRAYDEGYHVYQQIMRIESGEDIFTVANGYGLDNDSIIKLEKDPLALSYCDLNTLKIKYADLSKVNVFESVKRMGQLMAIKSYNLEIDAEADLSKQTILVFGTGRGAENLLNGIPENLVNIRAYIDSDKSKQFRMYKRRLIIPPYYIRFFKYDKIIITSRIYYDEMRETLIAVGVKKNKISGLGYLFDILGEGQIE